MKQSDTCMEGSTAMRAFEGPDPIRIQRRPTVCGSPSVDRVVTRGDDALFAASKVPRSFSFWDWCATLVSKVLRTRTPFSAFLAFSLSLPRRSSSSTPQLFPVPVPFPGIFDRMPTGLSLRSRRRILLKRALHVIVMALNFLHDGMCSFPSESLLTRCPSPAHRSIYKKIQGILAADGPCCGPIEVLASGRRFPQLLARLSELSSVVTKLGACGPYAHSFQGHQVPLDSEVMPELRPYRSLDASRLKLSGRGTFDATEFLEDDLCMAYRCPDLILTDRIPPAGSWPGTTDAASDVLELAKLWDAQGLLTIHRVPQKRFWLTRVFNNYKDTAADRQIGDRRGRNFSENKLAGPSSMLPSGSDIGDLFLDPRRQCLRIFCTDRKDFYHQFNVSYEKAIANSVGPPLRCSSLDSLKAYAEFIAREAEAKGSKQRRDVHGDMLHSVGLDTFQEESPPGLLVDECFVAFGALFQGDHGGVEFATQAHENLLKSAGLLEEESRLVAHRPFPGGRLLEGLVIDDYFALSVEDRKTPLESSLAASCFKKSQEVYLKHEILGSPQKDVYGETKGKVIGAELNSGPCASTQGIATCGAPISKRLSLSSTTLQLAQLSHTSDALHLCIVGAWTSIMLYRRPLMGIFSAVHRVVDASEVDASNPRLLPLSRKVANELTVAAVLAPLAVSNLAAIFEDKIYSTDASDTHGAITSAHLPKEQVGHFWRACKSKGAYSRLKTPLETVLLRLGVSEEGLEEDEDHQYGQSPWASLERPRAFEYDFIEVYAGSARVSKAAQQIGLVVGPPIDISFSGELDLCQTRVLSWITHMLVNYQLKSVMVEPVCTSFSLMRRPPLRSRRVPYGFDPHCTQTRVGNILALRALAILATCHRLLLPGLLEQPWMGMMRYLAPWKALEGKENVCLRRCDSCAYGSPHLKSFRMMAVHMDISRLARRCSRDHHHVIVEGKYTKASASYTEELAMEIALCFREAIRMREAHLEEHFSSLHVRGLENQFTNLCATTLQWKEEDSWAFANKRHINLLEMSSLLRLAEKRARAPMSQRIVNLVDSNVIRCAASKGRSSSDALSTLLLRYNAVCLAGDLYFTLPFVPTRFNTSDDPTRGRAVRTPSSEIQLGVATDEQVRSLLTLPPLRRWASNWARFVLGLHGFSLLDFCSHDRRRHAISWSSNGSSPYSLRHRLNCASCSIDFDSSLGFPGEGPTRGLFLLPHLLSWHLLLCFLSPLSLSGLRVVRAMDSHGAFGPRTPGDWKRAQLRMSRPPLPKGRPVTDLTSKNRERLLRSFLEWCEFAGFVMKPILDEPARHVEKINEILLAYGRRLYEAGKTYSHYVETINSVASLKPIWRRQLQASWDMAFSWVREERPVHHIAMPFQILLAMLSIALSWGWLNVAGLLALGWGALLRTSEMTHALRSDLLLPSDTFFSNRFALLALREPKTRFVSARHQSAKLDIPDLLSLVETAFQHLEGHQRLWPFSDQTLRHRFADILKVLRLDAASLQCPKTLDLGSLRPGGATWMMQTCEDSELVRRRGRWLNQRVMEIYIQEISSMQLLIHLSKSQRDIVFNTAATFPFVLEKITVFQRARIPTKAWFALLRSSEP